MPKNLPQPQTENSKAQDRFSGNLQRQLLGADLLPEHQRNYSRLLTTLLHGAPFQFILCEIRDEPLRDRLIATINEAAATQEFKSINLDAGEFQPDDQLGKLEARLEALAQEYTLIHLRGFDRWLTCERWQALNIRRDAIAERCRARLLWWLTPESVRQCALEAPDLWAWRSGVYEFSPAVPATLPAQVDFRTAIDNRSLPERARRISQIRAWLEQNPPDELRQPLLDELAGLLADFGELDEALRLRINEQLPLCEKLGDVRARAITLGNIADIHQARGQLAEALRIHLDEQIPVYEEIDDARSRAITLAKIADIHQTRGQLDEALHIYFSELCPIFEKLDDQWSKAVILGKIADIYRTRGQFDDALRIYRDEAIAVFEKLGDMRSRAITLGRVADIHQARGQLDEALRIRLNEEIPVYEKLGDLRSRAVALGKIASIHQLRGQLDEALRIHLEEQIPVYDKLGDVREQAVAFGKIADIYQTRGQLDEALRIRREQELPVFEKLGSMRERLVCQANIATILIQRNQINDRKNARALLQAALTTAQKIGLPVEVQQIKSWLKGMRQPKFGEHLHGPVNKSPQIPH